MTKESPPTVIHQIEDLVEKTGSKFLLASLTGKRMRQIAEYRNGGALKKPDMIPPLVGDITDTSMSIAMREIVEGKIVAGKIKKPKEPEISVEKPEIENLVTEDEIAAVFGELPKEGEDIFHE